MEAALLADYHSKEKKTLEDMLEFHVRFERIHPFQDGNGRIGRLILFKECLKYNMVPFPWFEGMGKRKGVSARYVPGRPG